MLYFDCACFVEVTHRVMIIGSFWDGGGRALRFVAMILSLASQLGS